MDEVDTDSDLYMLGLHLYVEHSLTDPEAFDEHIRFGILDVVSPQDIIKKDAPAQHIPTRRNEY